MKKNWQFKTLAVLSDAYYIKKPFYDRKKKYQILDF